MEFVVKLNTNGNPTFNYFARPQPKDLKLFYVMAIQKKKIGLSVFQNLLWVYGMAWMNVRFPSLKFCPSPPMAIIPVIDLFICINLPTSRSLARVRRDVIKPSDKLRLLKQPARKTREAVRAADYMVQTLRLISEKAHHVHKRSINATGMITKLRSDLSLSDVPCSRLSICVFS